MYHDPDISKVQGALRVFGQPVEVFPLPQVDVQMPSHKFNDIYRAVILRLSFIIFLHNTSVFPRWPKSVLYTTFQS